MSAMPLARVLVSAAAVALSLASLSAPTLAATAHNSQAGGAYRSSTNNCAATAYFPADSGCLSSFIQRYQDGDLPLPRGESARYRPRPRLQ